MAILTVGAGQAFASLAAAVAAAAAGDTINVSAGTYTNDFATIAKDLTIQGVGGLAHFVGTRSIPNGKALIVTQANVTLKNLELSGAIVPDQNGAGVRYDSGNLVMVNCYVHDNQEGLLSAPSATGTIDVQSSEFARNGGDGGYAHNIYIGEIQRFTFNNSYSHDSYLGQEIKSRAANTSITNSRLADNGGSATYVLDTPEGGNVLVQNSVLEKGANSPVNWIVNFGGNGGPWANSRLSLSNTTIINDRANPNTSLLNNRIGAPATISGGAVANLTAAQLDITKLSAPAVIAEPALDATSPAVTTTGPDTVTVLVSGDAYQGDAQFQVTVNGAAIGGVFVAGAIDAIGARQSYTLHGTFGGSPTVGVRVLNPIAGAWRGTTRALHVDGVTANGTALTPLATVLTAAAPSAQFARSTAPAAATHTIAVSLSEDAYQGDAQATLSLDGVSQGGTTTVTASHAAGGAQVVTLTGPFAAGAHTLGVAFLNDAWGGTADTDRNLYVDAISVDGVTQAGGGAALMTAGTRDFGIKVPTAASVPADDTLVLHLSEDAYQGDARFMAYVDSVAQGSERSVTAAHGAGGDQAFTFTGRFGAGAHLVQVDFLNDGYGGSAALDRNLYVDGISLNGVPYADSGVLMRAGGAAMSVGGGTDPVRNTFALVPPHG